MIKRVGKYELGQVLGQGSYGKVILATDTQTQKQYAIKILDKGKVKQDNLIENLRRQIQIMTHIEHPNIVKLHQVLSSHVKIYLVLQLVTGGQLFQKIKQEGPMPENQARYFFQQIISGVSFCQQHQIAHRDLKLQNILLDEKGIVKISDFGLSGLFKFDQNQLSLMHTTCGTVNYLAPQVFGNQGYDGHYADLWSCGVILYACLVGFLPFEDDSIARLIEKIVSGRYEIPKNISPQGQDLLQGLLNTDPRTRIHLDSIKQHPWFVQNYIEPEGIFSQPLSPTFKYPNIDEQIIDPQQMDAFQLLCFCVGNSINKLFDSGNPDEETHFVSSCDEEELVNRIKAAGGSCGLVEVEAKTEYKLSFQSKVPPFYSMTVEFRHLIGRNLVIFKRQMGSLATHRSVFGRIKQEVLDIIS